MGRIDPGGSSNTMAWKNSENQSNWKEVNSISEQRSRLPDSNGIDGTSIRVRMMKLLHDEGFFNP